MIFNGKDLAAGAIFIAIGLFLGLNAYLELELGSALRMGPGYFPVLLSCILVLLGLAIAVRALGVSTEAIGAIPWRGIPFILLGPVIFGATIQDLGLVPALALVVAVSAFASQRMRPLMAVMLTAGLVLLCVLIFHSGLGSPIPLFSPWLGI